MSCHRVWEEMLTTDMPNLKTHTKQARNAGTSHAESYGVERKTVREVTDEISSDKRKRNERKWNFDAFTRPLSVGSLEKV